MITIRDFRQLHINSIGVDGILANITDVQVCNKGMLIELNFTNRLGMVDKSKLKINYHVPEDCSRIDEKGRVHNFHNQNNLSYVIYNRRIAAETLVLLGLMFLNGYVPFDSLQNYCADVLDGSGTKKARDKYGLKFNISPTNLELVTKYENLKRNQHR